MTLASLVFLWLVRLTATEPGEPSWADGYGEVAAAIAEAAEARPLPGSSAKQTAAVLVTMGWHESRFDPNAIGDHGKAHGLFQIYPGTLGRPVPADPFGQADAALGLLRTSWEICKDRPLSERLSWYAAGGVGCQRRLELSRSRMREAAALLRVGL